MLLMKIVSVGHGNNHWYTEYVSFLCSSNLHNKYNTKNVRTKTCGSCIGLNLAAYHQKWWRLKYRDIIQLDVLKIIKMIHKRM